MSDNDGTTDGRARPAPDRAGPAVPRAQELDALGRVLELPSAERRRFEGMF
ncbi:hypothetical protein [Streptomyces sp. NPDC093149]|uniref:hypothetical protein n=1 Tax=Streptomyces sp. NPDC093149 TaxID=3366031 RepID=UPI0037FBF8ED